MKDLLILLSSRYCTSDHDTADLYISTIQYYADVLSDIWFLMFGVLAPSTFLLPWTISYLVPLGRK